MALSKQALKRQAAAEHNERYVVEKKRWEGMTRKEQIREIVGKAIDDTLPAIQRDLGNMCQKSAS